MHPALALSHVLAWASLAWWQSDPGCVLWHWNNPVIPTMNPPPIPAGSKEGPGHSAPLLISKGFSYQTSAQALKYKPICLFLPLEFAILRILSKSKNKMGKVTYRSAGKAKKKKRIPWSQEYILSHPVRAAGWEQILTFFWIKKYMIENKGYLFFHCFEKPGCF